MSSLEKWTKWGKLASCSLFKWLQRKCNIFQNCWLLL